MRHGCMHSWPTACDFCRWDWEVVDKIGVDKFDEINRLRFEIRHFAMTLWLHATETGIVDNAEISIMAFSAWLPESKAREALEVLERNKLVERIGGNESVSWELSHSGERFGGKLYSIPGRERWILAPGLEDWPAARARERRDPVTAS